jgi:hypothetical protein
MRKILGAIGAVVLGLLWWSRRQVEAAKRAATPADV